MGDDDMLRIRIAAAAMTCSVTTAVLASSSVSLTQDDDCDCIRMPWPARCMTVCRSAPIESLPSDARALFSSSELPPANLMVDKVLARLVGYYELPRDESGALVRSEHFYNDFEELDWIDITTLSNDESRIGTVAVWPTMMGIVVRDDDDSVQILYPSTRRNEIHIEDARWLGRGVEPRFLIPRETVAPEALPESARRR